MSMSDFSQHVPLSTFLQAHPDQGSLRVQVASGGGTFPVAGARVEVYRRPEATKTDEKPRSRRRKPDPHVLPGADR